MPQQRLTVQVLVSNRPWLGCVEVGVSTDAVARKVGVCQEAPLTIEGAAVAVETLCEEDHDVGELLHLVPYVAVGNLSETERRDALPHLEGLPDGLVGLVLPHLGRVVLNTEEGQGRGDKTL